jgi:NAD(P)-dependent dehydrogenase (short-subunit alcohol dehydrogenase family)
MAPHPTGSPDAGSTAVRRALRVIITGGSAGIGREMVTSFAAAGHHVLFSHLRSVEEASALADQHPRVTTARLDQGDFASVTAFATDATGGSRLRPFLLDPRELSSNADYLCYCFLLQYAKNA